MTISVELSGSPRSRILVSACFGFRACRHDGKMIQNDAVASFLDCCECLPVCPEEELGLGTPRDKIRIVLVGNRKKLLQPTTGLDLTTEISEFSRTFLANCGELDGAILKGRSPSCGVGDTPLFADAFSDQKTDQKTGLVWGMFAAILKKAKPTIPIVTESDLENESLRQGFWEDICRAGRTRRQNGRSFVIGSGSS